MTLLSIESDGNNHHTAEHRDEEKLQEMKLYRKTYEEVLERLLEDLQELNRNTKEDIKRAIHEIEEGRFRTHEQLKLRWASDDLRNHMVRFGIPSVKET